jgi:hypothetical protein
VVSVAAARANLGLGTAATQAATSFLASVNNLSDLPNPATARTTLGLGTAAIHAHTDYDAAGAAAAAQAAAVAASQPIDSDLTAIAALTTTTFGRSLLTQADAGTARGTLGLGSMATQTSSAYQPIDSDLTAIAALATTTFGRSLLTQASAAAARTTLGLTLPGFHYKWNGSTTDSYSNPGTGKLLYGDDAIFAVSVTDSDGHDLSGYLNGLGIAVGERATGSVTVRGLNGGVWIGTVADWYDTSSNWAQFQMEVVSDPAAPFANNEDVYVQFAVGASATSSGGGGAYLAIADNLSDVADPVAARTNIGAQTYAPILDGISTVTSNDFDQIIYSIADDGLSWGVTYLTPFARTVIDDTDAATMRTTLGLGTAATSASTAFQPSDSDLTAIAALTTTTFGRSLLTLADAAAGRTSLGLGTAATNATGDFQPVDSDLTAIAALTTTTFGRSLLTQADAAATRTTLGLGTAATSASTAFDASGAAAAAQAASQPLDSDLTAIAALTTTTYGRAFLALADAAAGRTALGLGTAATATGPSGTIVGTTDTQTLTNKRVTRRVDSVTSTATYTFDTDSYDSAKITAQAAALTIANPSGTPTGMQPILIRIKDNGTARALSYGTQWRAIGVTLPTTTVVSKTLYIGGFWNSDDSKVDVTAVGQEV